MIELRILIGALLVAIVIGLVFFLLPPSAPVTNLECSPLNYGPPPDDKGWVLRKDPSGEGCVWEPEAGSNTRQMKD